MFLATPTPDVVEAALAAFGMAFLERRVHRGQGTANACATFENAFFELLHATDAADLKSELVAPLGLAERMDWARTGACPFGICLRPRDEAVDLAALPFATWLYRPAYLPAEVGIPIVTPRGQLHEPLVFLSARARPPAATSSPPHRGKPRTLTAVRAELPSAGAAMSEGLAWLIASGLFSFVDAAGFRLDLEWDHGVEGGARAFAEAPLMVRW